jgi:hypothetical protein
VHDGFPVGGRRIRRCRHVGLETPTTEKDKTRLAEKPRPRPQINFDPSAKGRKGEKRTRTGGASCCVSSGTMWTSPLSTRIDMSGVGFAVTFAKTPSLSVPPPLGRLSPPGRR